MLADPPPPVPAEVRVSPAPPACEAAFVAAVPAPPSDFLPRLGQEAIGYIGVLGDWHRCWCPGVLPDPPRLAPPWVKLPPERIPHPTPGSIADVMLHLKQTVTYFKHFAMPTLGLDQEVIGYVANLSKRQNPDGDLTMDVVPLPAYVGVLVYDGRFRPRRPIGLATTQAWLTARGHALCLRSGGIHTEMKLDRHRELAGFLTSVRQALQAGQTPVVSVRGRWTFDPFHSGWVEIHPVRAAKLLSVTGEGYPEPLPLPEHSVPGIDDEP